MDLERLKRAIEAARADGNEAAARALEARLPPTGEQIHKASDRANTLRQMRADDAKTYAPTGSFMENALAGAGSTYANVGRSLGQAIGKVSTADVEEARLRDAPLMDTWGGMLGAAAPEVIASAIPAGAVTRGARALGLGRTAARRGIAEAIGQTAAAGTIAAARPVGEGESRLGNAAFDATVAAPLALGSSAVRAVTRGPLRDAPEQVQRATRSADDLGVPYTIEDIQPKGSVSSVVKSATDRILPFSRGPRVQTAQGRALTKSVLSEVGIVGDSFDDATMRAAKDEIVGTIDDIARNHSAKLDAQTALRAAQWLDDMEINAGIDPAQVNKFRNLFRAYARTENQFGEIPGERYQQFRTRIREQADKQTDTNLKRAYEEFDDIVLDSMERHLPADVLPKYRQARYRYAFLRNVVEPLAEENLAQGTASPASIARRVKQFDEEIAYGNRPNTRRIAEAADLVKSKIPDSGTAQRTMVQNSLGQVGKAAAVGAAGGAVGHMFPTSTAVAAGLGYGLNYGLNSRIAANGIPDWMQLPLGRGYSASIPTGAASRALPNILPQGAVSTIGASSRSRRAEESERKRRQRLGLLD